MVSLEVVVNNKKQIKFSVFYIWHNLLRIWHNLLRDLIYFEYLVGNEAVQFLNYFLPCSGLLEISFAQFKLNPIIYCQFTALEFMRSHSQQKFVEESEICIMQ